ncbi:hypothetical protein HAZT_HAZT002893 [Hyalella azteca]|uniref:Ig-like domain-containing protein n=1 Tax=Hyalella azteca TaxID=294128 RepID=A0A6A0H4T3_HYAAZ|nr:hypothetical protein HAZT_HAZT002893 [Hyalella azteca]
MGINMHRISALCARPRLVVTFDGSRQGVSVSTTKGATTTSILRIEDVRLQDSGVYICSPEGMREASVTLTVLHGELPQAMQTGSTCRACFGSHVLLTLIVTYLVGLPAVEALSCVAAGSM